MVYVFPAQGGIRRNLPSGPWAVKSDGPHIAFRVLSLIAPMEPPMIGLMEPLLEGDFELRSWVII